MRRTVLRAKAPLARRAPLRQVSVKRAAKLAASGVRVGRHAGTGPDAHTVEVVLTRDNWSCACCGFALSGVRGRDYAIHHRRPRRTGGDRRPDVNLPSNLVPLHSDCHERRVESHRAVSYDNGWLLHAGDVPSQRPILHAVHGWTYLTDDGRCEFAPPPVSIGGEIR